MVTILPEDAKTEKAWTGRDDNHGHHHGLVRLHDSPIRISVHWKASDEGKVMPVGKYQIDLRELIRSGFAREVDECAFLRFQSASERIEIAINRSGPALVVGRNPLV